MDKDRKKEENLSHLSSFLGKAMKLKFGKGPESCLAVVQNNLLVVRVHHFMTPSEKILWEKNELGLAMKVRSVLIDTIFEEVKEELSTLTGLKITACCHDWDFKSNQGVLLFLAGPSIEFEQAYVNQIFEQSLRQTIQSVSERVHKRPMKVNLLQVSQNMHIVESYDVLIQAEHILHNSGFQDLLMERSHEIRHNYEQSKKEFEQILGSEITQIFLIWDYKQNKSYIIFCML